MKYLSLTSVKDIYFVLSQNTTTPDTQGATQKISAMRHLFAFYRYCVKNKVTECDLKIKANRDEFVDYVSEIVKLDGDNYTANFYSTIAELEDCRVGSNFYSAGVVPKSRINKTATLPYPTKHNLLNVQNEVLVQKENVNSEINEYLTSEKTRLAFAFWLVRKDVIDEANLINDVHDKIAEKYSDKLADSIIPNNDASKDCVMNNFQLQFAPNYEELTKKIILSAIAEIEKGNMKNNNQPLQKIYYGAPGTGKSHAVKIKTGELDAAGNEHEMKNVFRTTFHPDTDYATFVGCYKPTMQPTSKEEKTLTGKDEEITYEFVPQAFTDAYVYAYNHQEEPTYLVIEEINRGNCAQIFGDLFQLLDRKADGTSEYTIKADKDLAKYLLYAKDEKGNDILTNKDGINDGKLRLPANLNILATMNTSDQSLFPMDSAFKRRWEWEYIAISYTELKSSAFMINVGEKYSWVEFIKQVNKRIFALTQSEDKELGNFFIKDSIEAEQFKSKVMFYLWYEVLRDEVENSRYFFYYTTQDETGKETNHKFTFKDLYGDNAKTILEGFLKYIAKGAE